MLRIRVPDLDHPNDLLEYLRSCGCIAYTSGEGAIEALLPDVHWREAETRIRACVEEWRAGRGDVALEIEPLT